MRKQDEQVPTADAGPVERVVGRPCPKRAALLRTIAECKREVAACPAWMRVTSAAPKWMEG